MGRNGREQGESLADDIDTNAPTRIADDAPVADPSAQPVDMDAATVVAADAARPPAPAPPRAAEARPPAIATGTVLFGEYEIVELLGAGGMGEVYRARHRRLDEPRAIKVMHAELSRRKGASEFFDREAKALLAVQHPAVVHCHDMLSDEHGRVYLIMEMVEGISLAKRIERQGPLPPDEVAVLGARVAAGLSAAHRRGVIHRDVSPDNIVLPGGKVAEAKLIDFGIAKILQEGQGTIVDGFKGKLGYASPEQLGFFGGKIDGRSDFYSLGLVLCAAALGRPLGMGTTVMEAVDARRQFQRVPDEIPIGLRSAIEPLLALDPKDRPQQVERLFVVPGGEPIPAAAPAAPVAAAPASGVVWGLAGGFIAIAAGIAVWLVFLPASAPAPAPGRPEPVVEKTAAPAAPEAAASAESAGRAPAPESPQPGAEVVIASRKRGPSALDQVRIVGLLQGAEAALSEDRLQSPKGDNAYEKYRAVLAIDPGNEAAQRGLRAIAGRYLTLAEASAGRADPAEARSYLARALEISPDHPRLSAVRTRIESQPSPVP